MLEGIGLIEKKSKNNIQWKGGACASDEPDAEAEQLQAEVHHLQVRLSGYERVLKDPNT